MNPNIYLCAILNQTYINQSLLKNSNDNTTKSVFWVTEAFTLTEAKEKFFKEMVSQFGHTLVCEIACIDTIRVV